MTTGAQLRDAGIADTLAADTSATRGYADLVSATVAGYPSGWRFDAEQVRADVTAHHPSAAPHSPGLLGGVLRGLLGQGVIRHVGYVQSSRPTSRRRVLSVWEVV